VITGHKIHIPRYLFEKGVDTSQFGDLMSAVLQSVADAGRKRSDLGHVGGQVVHLILHLLEIILHLNTQTAHWILLTLTSTCTVKYMK
jgi:hypothetical protein